MNWRELMTRVRAWLSPMAASSCTSHHRSGAYLFDRTDAEDWIAQHFFTGGVMLSHHLIRQYADLFEIERNGAERHALSAHGADWLENLDIHRDEIERVLRGYGGETALWDAAPALVLSRHLRPVRLR